MIFSPVSYSKLSACFCVPQVETQCVLRRTESSLTQCSFIAPPLFQANLICFPPPGDLQDGLVSDSASSVTSGIISPTAYLLHQISQADQEATCDLTLSSPVTTSMPLKAHLGAKVLSSGGLGLLTACQLMSTQSLDRNDPSLGDTA